MQLIRLATLAPLLILLSCQSMPDKLPYPAFVVTDDLPDVFLAELPGTRAKRFETDMSTRSGSYRLDLPAGWKGTSGASPGKAVEIFVVDGDLALADVTLTRGGYAYLPSGSLGFNLSSAGGARVLYFLSDVNPNAVIKTPLILDSGLLEWDEVAPGQSTKELRADPGSGARSWMLKVSPGAETPWTLSSGRLQGFLVAGDFRQSECVDGKISTSTYAPGGYFLRPAQTISGGPETAAITDAVWFLREVTATSVAIVEACIKSTVGDL